MDTSTGGTTDALSELEQRLLGAASAREAAAGHGSFATGGHAGPTAN